MFQSKTIRFLSKIIITLAILSVCGLGYLNFGQASHPDETMSTPLAVLQNRLAHTQPHAVTVDSCKKSIQYTCIEKAFSQTGKTSDGQEASFDCVTVGSTVSSGAKICPTGQVFTFDSSAAAKKCVGDTCESHYNFNEYTCVYRQVNENGSSPIQATADTLDQALAETYTACIGVAETSAAIANNNNNEQ